MLEEQRPSGDGLCEQPPESLAPSVLSSQSVDTPIIASAAKFAELFCGNDRFYGVYDKLTQQQENGKIIGTDRRTVKDPVTLDLYERHLAGDNGLGVCPIRSDSTVLFGAIDIDVYDGLDHETIAQTLERHKLPLVVCRSKSGGAHIYLFTAEPIAAAVMIVKLKEIAAMLGHGAAEIFPKQKVFTDGGSWINLPYFNGILGARYALRGEDGAPLTIEEFLHYAGERRQTAEWFSKPSVSSIDLPQGPPCLQHLVQIGFPNGTRNNGLYNLGVYYKKANADDWKTLLQEANRRFMQSPLDNSEVAGLIKSVANKKYGYTCDQQPISIHCNATLCRSRKFGIGQNNSFPDFGPLKKVLTDPPTWIWTVNNSPITLTTDQLLEPWLFKKACANVLSICMSVPKQDTWDALVTKAMAPENLIVEEAPEDVTFLGQFQSHLEGFCTGHVQAYSKDQMLLNRPWDDGKFTWFQIINLVRYFEQKKFKIDVRELHRRLKETGGVSEGQIRIKGRKVSLWKVPSFAKQTEGIAVPNSVTWDEPF